jgi:hypothetical protein
MRFAVASHSIPVPGLALLAALLLAAPAGADDLPGWLAGEVSLATGLDYREGRYGENERSEIVYLPVSLAYLFDEFVATDHAFDQLELKVSVPWLAVHGPVNPDQGFVGRGTVSDTRRGIGDVLLRATYVWFPAPDTAWPALELSSQVKLPTASVGDNLGTGEPAYGFQIDVYRGVGRFTPIATFGYRIVEPARGFDLDDSAYASVGSGYRITRELSAGLLYDWWESSSGDRGDAHELFPYVAYRITPWLRITPYGVFGLSPDATDWGCGLQLRASVRLD